MANQEEEITQNGNNEQDNTAANQEQRTGDETTGTDSSQKKDPAHNTGDEHMKIDEEGAEISPDDQV